MSDVLFENGDLKKTFVIPGPYTKTRKPRAAYILAKWHRVAVEDWLNQRVTENVRRDGDSDKFRGFDKNEPLFLSKKGGIWRTLAFQDKKYKDSEGNTRTTKVCGSFENLIRGLFKGAGLSYGSSHSKGNLASCYTTANTGHADAANDVTYLQFKAA